MNRVSFFRRLLFFSASMMGAPSVGIREELSKNSDIRIKRNRNL